MRARRSQPSCSSPETRVCALTCRAGRPPLRPTVDPPVFIAGRVPFGNPSQPKATVGKPVCDCRSDIHRSAGELHLIKTFDPPSHPWGVASLGGTSRSSRDGVPGEFARTRVGYLCVLSDIKRLFLTIKNFENTGISRKRLYEPEMAWIRVQRKLSDTKCLFLTN